MGAGVSRRVRVHAGVRRLLHGVCQRAGQVVERVGSGDLPRAMAAAPAFLTEVPLASTGQAGNAGALFGIENPADAKRREDERQRVARVRRAMAQDLKRVDVNEPVGATKPCLCRAGQASQSHLHSLGVI